MSRFYTVTFEAVAVTAAQDFFEINPAANKPVKFCGLMLSQSSDVGDAAEEILRVSITRIPATFTTGSGGTAITEGTDGAWSLSATNATAAFAAEVNNTTIATSSATIQHLLAYQFNIRVGLEVFLPPELWPEFINGAAGVVRLLAAPTDSLTMSGTLFLCEDG